MSHDWVRDINGMHQHYSFHEQVDRLPPEKLLELLKFRSKFLREELNELDKAIDEGDAEGVVDALIDLEVVAIGTADLFHIDQYKAWNAVLRANLGKALGVKPGRPNPFGFPDLIKPEGWKAPTHAGNHGLVAVALEKKQ